MDFELEPGVLIGRYRLTRPLAAGGMGSVWAAVDTRLDREVALKLLPRLLVGDPSVERRFEREARALARLSHPNVVTVFDVGSFEHPHGSPTPYLVMELVGGRSLRKILAAGALDPDRAVRLLTQVAAGLAAAHAAGVVHRDLKPSNIMVDEDDQVTVLDFGLARFMTSASGGSPDDCLTTPGMVLGSCAYMAPEQARGEGVTPASDVFALGAVAWEMLVGRRAFDGASPLDVLQSVVRCEPTPLAEAAPATPCQLARVVDRCLTRNPALRYPSCSELAIALRGLSAAEPPASEAPAVVAPRRRPWAAWAVIAAVLVTAAAVGFGLARRGHDAPQPARVTRVRELATPGGRLSQPAGHGPGGVLVVRDLGEVSEVLAVDDGGGVIPVLTARGGLRWRSPRSSADGRLLAVGATRPTDGSSEVRVAPLAGGPALAVLPDAAAPAWLGRGRLAYLQPSTGELQVVDLAAPTPQPLARDGRSGRVEHLAGHASAGLAASLVAEPMQVVRWPVDLGRVEGLWSTADPIRDIAWSRDGSTVIVSAGDRLVELSLRGPARTVFTWPGLAGVTTTADPARLVAVVRTAWTELVAISPQGAPLEVLMTELPADPPIELTSGRAVAFRRDLGGRPRWWLRAAAGGDAPLECGPGHVLRAVPDAAGERVACLVEVGGGSVELRLTGVTVGGPTTLAADLSPAAAPAWSPDGAAVAVVRHEPAAVMTVAVAGGAQRVVAETPAIGLAYSHDGSWLMYRVPGVGSRDPAGVWAAPVSPGQLPRRVTDRAEAVAWRPGGPGLWQLRRSPEGLELWEADLAGPWRRRSLLAAAGITLDRPTFTVDPVTGRLLLSRSVGSDRLVEIGPAEDDRILN